MLIGLREEDRELIKELGATFKKLGEDITKELKTLNKNLEENRKSKK